MKSNPFPVEANRKLMGQSLSDMRRIPDNPRADNKIMEQHEEWQVVRRTEVTVETHTVTTVRRQPSTDIGLDHREPEPDFEVVILPELKGR